MFDSLIKDVDVIFKDKAYLTVEDVALLLGCDPSVIYNWTKRSNPKRRPPRITVGKSVRFPKREFTKWLSHEQDSVG
jgi:excisionase family DNA binding protein